MMPEKTESKYTMKATTENFFRVMTQCIATMVEDWIYIPDPLIGERLLKYFRDHKNHQQIVTMKDGQIRALTGRV